MVLFCCIFFVESTTPHRIHRLICHVVPGLYAKCFQPKTVAKCSVVENKVIRLNTQGQLQAFGHFLPANISRIVADFAEFTGNSSASQRK